MGALRLWDAEFAAYACGISVTKDLYWVFHIQQKFAVDLCSVLPVPLVQYFRFLGYLLCQTHHVQVEFIIFSLASVIPSLLVCHSHLPRCPQCSAELSASFALVTINRLQTQHSVVLCYFVLAQGLFCTWHQNAPD